jgi:KDO2-lipid IV(A) lauroyltransferase
MDSNFVGRVILFFLRTIAYLYSIQPRRWQVRWGNGLGALFYYLRLRQKVVLQNLNFAYPHDELIRNRVFRESYRHLGNLILEILLILGPMKSFVLKYVDLQGLEHLREAKKRGKGVIFLASHLGNWEVMAATGGVLADADLMLVTKHLKPEWIHQAIEKGRLNYGVRATYEPKTLRDVLSHLKKNGTVGFVLDQYAGPPIGVRVPFFGVPVGTSQAVATLAKRTGATVLPVENYRTSEGRWAISILPPLEWKQNTDSQGELALNTAEYAKVIEKSVFAHPGQWLWTHRRFKGDLAPLRAGEWNEPRTRS